MMDSPFRLEIINGSNTGPTRSWSMHWWLPKHCYLFGQTSNAATESAEGVASTEAARLASSRAREPVVAEVPRHRTLTAADPAERVATLRAEAHLLSEAAALVEAASTRTAEHASAHAIATTETVSTDAAHRVAAIETQACTARREAASCGRAKSGSESVVIASLRGDGCCDSRLLRCGGRCSSIGRARRCWRDPRSRGRRGRWGCCRTSAQSCRSGGRRAWAYAWANTARTSACASRNAGGGTYDSSVGAGHHRGRNADGDRDELRHLHRNGDGDLLDFLDVVVVVLPAFIVAFDCRFVGTRS
jgi:hypothetical protein